MTCRADLGRESGFSAAAWECSGRVGGVDGKCCHRWQGAKEAAGRIGCTIRWGAGEDAGSAAPRRSVRELGMRSGRYREDVDSGVPPGRISARWGGTGCT